MELQQVDDDALVKRIVQKTIETEKQIRRQQILYNTRLLMENYREMRAHIENAVSEVEELQEAEFDALRVEGVHLDSVRQTKLKTAMMLANIDRAMEELRQEYADRDMEYKFTAFRLHYVDGLPNEEIADRLSCGKNTPSRWMKELIRKMSVKLFGVDGIERW